MIATQPPVSARPHRITLQDPGSPVPDGSGGYTESWTDLAPPQLSASIDPLPLRGNEFVDANTVTAMRTYLIGIPYHPGVSTKTRVLFKGRTFSVTGVRNREERNVD